MKLSPPFLDLADDETAERKINAQSSERRFKRAGIYDGGAVAGRNPHAREVKVSEHDKPGRRPMTSRPHSGDCGALLPRREHS